MGSFRELEVWKLGRELVAICYKLTDNLPDSEKFGLTSQIRRAAVSIPTNIAEGAGRKTDPAFAAFLRIALGSVFELETLLTLTVDLGYLKSAEVEPFMLDLRKIGIKIQNFMSSLKVSVVREREVSYAFSYTSGDCEDEEQPEDHLKTT